jgi:RNA 2',3'-cyclic 3'-phosphodiesterase
VRAFVAVDVPEADGSGEAPAPRHITLRFLGEVPLSRVGPIVSALESVGQSVAPFDLRLEGVGAFPNPTSPRVVWIGVTHGREQLTDLAERTRAVLEGEGSSSPEPRFVPHLTWFRVRSPADVRAARDVLSGQRPAPAPQTVRVGELRLKESELRRGGAVHRTLATVPLTGGATSP